MNITIDDLLNHVKTYNPEEIEIIKKAYTTRAKQKIKEFNKQ